MGERGERRKRARADRDPMATLGVAKEVFDAPWDVMGARTSVGFLDRNEELVLGRGAEGGVRVEDGEDHLCEEDNGGAG
jgi:hypothetical protein